MPTSGYRWVAVPERVNRSWNLPGSQGSVHARRLVQRLSRTMDTAFEVPLLGWRFGWDAVVGLLPGVGDVATTLVSLYIVALAARSGVGRITVARMGLNVAIDLILGTVPFVGDLFDVWFKANQRNAALLEKRLAEPSHRQRAEAADWLFVGAIAGGLLALLAVIVTLSALAIGALWNAASGAV